MIQEIFLPATIYCGQCSWISLGTQCRFEETADSLLQAVIKLPLLGSVLALKQSAATNGQENGTMISSNCFQMPKRQHSVRLEETASSIAEL